MGSSFILSDYIENDEARRNNNDNPHERRSS